MAEVALETMAPPLAPVIVVSIDSVHAVPFNANVEDLGTFNALVESIKKHGMVEPLVVRPLNGTIEDVLANPGAFEFDCVGGEHRLKASKVAGLRELSVSLIELSEDEHKALSIQLNSLKGRLNAKKFADTWHQLERKYGYHQALRMIGMAHQEKQVQTLLSRLARQLPASMREEVLQKRDKIRNVEDIAAVVQSIYARHGQTLQANYIIFTYNGKVQTMVRVNEANQKKLQMALEQHHDANELLANALVYVAGGVPDETVPNDPLDKVD